MATMDWVVFGDDWGRHASTTQHLVSHLPQNDRVVWLDSLGMRAPELSRHDLIRVLERVAPRRECRHADRCDQPPFQRIRDIGHVRPIFAPWHTSPAARAVNRLIFATLWPRLLAKNGFDRPIALIANPIASAYVDLIDPRQVAYLRLDDFANLPGVDPGFVARFEPALLAAPADGGLSTLVAAPNPGLLADVRAPTLLLPQAVDPDRFAIMPLDPPDTRVLGYWGLVSPWLDQALVHSAARHHPDWTFEFRGPIGTDISTLRALPNVRFLPAVPHPELAPHCRHWRAAWMPFRVDPGLASLSPLKLREYLASGLPTAGTPLPEVQSLPVTVITAVDELTAFLELALGDTRDRRQARRDSQAGDTWAARAHLLRDTLAALPPSPPTKAPVPLSALWLRSKRRP